MSVWWLMCVYGGRERRPQGIAAAEVEAGAEDCGSSLHFTLAPQWLIRGQKERKKEIDR